MKICAKSLNLLKYDSYALVFLSAAAMMLSYFLLVLSILNLYSDLIKKKFR